MIENFSQDCFSSTCLNSIKGTERDSRGIIHTKLWFTVSYGNRFVLIRGFSTIDLNRAWKAILWVFLKL